jgi:hypothetical protein
VTCETDRECLAFAARCVSGKANRDLVIARIDSTLHLEFSHVSEAALANLSTNPLATCLGPIPGEYFDSSGKMRPL